MANTKLKSFIILLLLGFIWGTGYSIARYATLNGVPPLGYSFWQSLGPAILMGIIGLIFHQNIKLNIPHLRYYLICGLTGITIPNTNMYLAAPHLPAGILAVIVNTVPIVAYPMAILAQVEKFQWIRFVGILLAIMGLMLIIIPKSSLPDPHSLPWVFSTLITPISFAFCSVYIARFRPADATSLSLATGTLLASSVLLIPLVVLTGNFYLPHLHPTTSDWVILLEIILSSTGYVLFFQLIKIAGPVYYSLVDTIVSLTGLFWGYLIFHEKLNIWSGSAVILIIGALILVTQRQQEKLC